MKAILLKKFFIIRLNREFDKRMGKTKLNTSAGQPQAARRPKKLNCQMIYKKATNIRKVNSVLSGRPNHTISKVHSLERIS